MQQHEATRVRFMRIDTWRSFSIEEKTFLLIRDQQYFRSHSPWSNLRRTYVYSLIVAKKRHFKHFCSIEV